MKLKWTARAALCGTAISLLAGCVNPVQVKDVQENKTAYLDDHFAPADVPASVVATVNQADADAVKFKRAVLQLKWTYNVDDKEKTTTSDETRTLTSVGGSLLESLSEGSRNGVPTSQLYELTYRNMLALKSQSMNLGANFAPMQMEVKNFKHFDPISSLKAGLEYDFEYGTTVQIMNYHSGRTVCERGDAKPASEVYASLTGEALGVICTNYNMNNVVQNKIRYVYLQNYGFGIAMHVEQAAGINEVKVVSIKFE